MDIIRLGVEGKPSPSASRFFHGNRTRPVVEAVGRTPLVVETAASREFKTGENVHLKIAPDALLVLDR